MTEGEVSLKGKETTSGGITPGEYLKKQYKSFYTVEDVEKYIKLLKQKLIEDIERLFKRKSCEYSDVKMELMITGIIEKRFG